MIIKKNTVFVLGAGASAPFGYPTGNELTQKICYDSQPLGIAKLLTTENDERVDVEQTIIRLRQNFERSGKQSIDLFLKDSPEYKNLGKQIIASILLPKENEDRLFDRKNENNWYLPFWNMIDHSFENIDKHDLHFITFNYDRSLEHFLFTALYNSYSGKISSDKCAAKINSTDIIHAYGCLAHLPWQDSFGEARAYTPNAVSRNDLEGSVNNLFLLGEERENQQQSAKLDKIKKIMAKATFIYFIGFSFDEENLNILGDDFKNADYIWGTSFGLGKVKEERAKDLIKGKTNIKDKHPTSRDKERINRIDMFPVKAHEFLRDNIYLA